jgi:OTT_1508-like deaminase
MFYASYDEVNAAEFQGAFDSLAIIPATPLRYVNYPNIAKKYKVKTKDAWKPPTVGPELPVRDFWEFVQARTRHISEPLSSLRPQLFEWNGAAVATETVHAEIKVAIHCLNRRRRRTICIRGVSKQPCFFCEAYFSAWNAHTNRRVWFQLAAGHKKAYPGWSPSGIDWIDEKVIERIWEVVDRLIADVKRIESKDSVAASY